MGTFVYLILVAVCSFIVYNIVEKLKIDYGMHFVESRTIELICIILLGFVLAGMVGFLLKFILVPLLLLALVYFIAIKFRR